MKLTIQNFYLLFNIHYSISSFHFHLCSFWLTFCSRPLPVFNFPVLFRNLYHVINMLIDHLTIQSIIMCGRLFPKAFNGYMSTAKQANWKTGWLDVVIYAQDYNKNANNPQKQVHGYLSEHSASAFCSFYSNWLYQRLATPTSYPVFIYMSLQREPKCTQCSSCGLE